MDRDDLRIGDAEREKTMADLREHFAQGRLTHEELDERLDRTLAAKTVRDLAQVTADLPGHAPGRRDDPARHRPAPEWHAPEWHGHDWHGHDWRESMAAYHKQMRVVRQAQRDMRRQWRGHAARRHPHRGPHPIVGVLVGLAVLSMIFGGFGLFKVLLAVALGAMVFSLVHRRFHRRG